MRKSENIMKSARDLSAAFIAALSIAILTVASIPAAGQSQPMSIRNGPAHFYASWPGFSFQSRQVRVFSFFTKVSDGKGNIRRIIAESSISRLSFRATGTGPHLMSRNDNDYFFSEIRGPEYSFSHGLIPSHPEGPFGRVSGSNALPGYISPY